MFAKKRCIRQHRSPSRRTDERGAVAVEFALIVPILLLIVLGIVDFGSAINANTKLATAVRAGCQFAVANSNDLDGVIDTATNASLLDTSLLTVTAVEDCRCDDGTAEVCDELCDDYSPPQYYITVKAQYQHSLLFSYPGVSNPMTLEEEMSVRIR